MTRFWLLIVVPLLLAAGCVFCAKSGEPIAALCFAFTMYRLSNIEV